MKIDFFRDKNISLKLIFDKFLNYDYLCEKCSTSKSKRNTAKNLQNTFIPKCHSDGMIPFNNIEV